MVRLPAARLLPPPGRIQPAGASARCVLCRSCAVLCCVCCAVQALLLQPEDWRQLVGRPPPPPGVDPPRFRPVRGPAAGPKQPGQGGFLLGRQSAAPGLAVACRPRPLATATGRGAWNSGQPDPPGGSIVACCLVARVWLAYSWHQLVTSRRARRQQQKDLFHAVILLVLHPHLIRQLFVGAVSYPVLCVGAPLPLHFRLARVCDPKAYVSPCVPSRRPSPMLGGGGEAVGVEILPCRAEAAAAAVHIRWCGGLAHVYTAALGRVCGVVAGLVMGEPQWMGSHDGGATMDSRGCQRPQVWWGQVMWG